jgi:hypothetical protein
MPSWAPWVIALAVLVVLGLVWVGWRNAHRAADADLAAPRPADLVPKLPDAPRLPDAPIPRPK